MEYKKQKREKFGVLQFSIRLVMDIAATSGAWFFSYYLRFFILNGVVSDSYLFYITLYICAVVCVVIFNNVNKLYEESVTSKFRQEIAGLFKTSLNTFVTFTIIYYFLFSQKISRIHLVLFWAFMFVFLVIGRYIVNIVLSKEIKTGHFKQRVLLVGYGSRLEDYFKAAKDAGERSRLVIAAQFMSFGHKIEGVGEISALSLEKAVDVSQADIIVISFPHENKDIEWKMIDQGMELFSQRVFTLPGIPKSYAGSHISEFHFIPTLELNSSALTSGKRFLKRCFDLIACSVAVILLSPLFLLISILVKSTSKGPVFFKQKRVTRDGRVFTMLKFRSMRTDMPEGDVHWTEENDPRVTKIGKFLRKTSLDEIPQFLNVIEGSMSLIGPRPERPELEDKFVKQIPGYHMRHRMKAGISGWAQVNGLRGNTSLEKRIDFDLYYVRNWSFLFDIEIVFLTFFKGFINKNAY